MTDRIIMDLSARKPPDTTVSEYIARYGLQYSHRNGETELPTVDGWYWRKLSTWELEVVKVDAKNKWAYEVGEEEPDFLVPDDKTRWWGPIPEPAL